MKKLFKKVLVYLSVIAIVVQSLSPVAYLQLNSKAYAQEVTPTDTSTTVDQTTTPTDTATPTPTIEQTTPTDAVTPTPSDTPTETLTPSPTPEPSPADATPVDNLSPPVDNSEVQGDSTSVTPEPTLTSPTASEGQAENPKDEQLNIIVLENVSAPSIDLEAIESQGSAVLTTDKPDYAPTDTALITGSNLLSNTTYTLRVWSDDEPPTSTTVEVTSDENGVFAYAYQLDGTYRPDYSAELRDSEGNKVASTTFTDTPTSGCTTDTAGANDEPGQKDLNKMCVDYSGLPNSVSVNWNWDEKDPGGSIGGNTGDACSLFDTDNDGNANYSLCVIIDGDPSVYQSKVLYSCGDARPDRCTQPIVVLSPSSNTTCTADVQGTDPFPGPPPSEQGDDYPNDSVASCNISLSDVGGVGVANLIDVCSYPSGQPNSDPSDCIVVQDNKGLIQVIKNVVPDNQNTNWVMTATGPTGFTETIAGDGSTPIKSVDLGTYSITETAGANTNLNDYSTTWSCTKNGSAYLSGSGATASNIVIDKVGNNPPDSIVCTFTNTLATGTITVNKTLVPLSDPGLFNLRIDGATAGTGANVGDGGTTGAVTVSTTSQHTVSETAGTSTSLSDYATTYSCNNNLSGSGTSIPAFSVTANQNVICTFTNTKQATVIVEKNTTGGDGTFGFTSTGANGLPASFNVSTTTGSGSQTYTVTPGVTYSVSETVPSGWDLTSSSCTNGTPSSFTPTAGETVTCTFNNTKKGHLVVQKTTIPGGDQTVFTINATGNGTITNGGAGTVTDATDKDYEVTPGIYSVAETVPSGWSKTGDTCQNVVVSAGATVNCLLTNTKRGHVIIEKDAISDSSQVFTFNNNFGNGNPATFNLTDDSTPGLPSYDAEVLPGTYSVSEDAVAGWQSPETTSCTNGSPVNAITVAPGETVTCTFVNEQLAKIILVKNTIGGNGTFDFDATGTGLPTDIDLTTVGGTVSQTFENLDLDNTYTITENVPAGWDLTSSSCTGTNTPNSITPNTGETVTCTFTNTKLANLIIVKNTVGGDGTFDFTTTGSGISDFSLLTSDGTNSKSFTNINPGTYSVSESPIPNGWVLSSATCSNEDNPVSSINISAGQTVTCTFTNTKDATLTLVKTVTNDNGGTAVENNFQAKIDGNNVPWGVAQVVSATSHTASEVTLPGYSASSWGTDCAANGSVTLAPGQNKTCTITNDDIAPTLNLVKDVTNDNGGNAVAENWDLTARRLCVADDTDPTCGFTDSDDSITFHTVRAGRSYVLSESGPSGYTAGSWSCDGGTLNGNKLTLGLDENVTCTITNDDIAPTVTLIKEVSGGDAGENYFGLTIGGQGVNSGQTVDVDANTPIALDEAGLEGYSFDSITGDGCPSELGGTVTLDEGGSITCTIINTRNTGDISGFKFEDLNGDGVWDDGEPGLDGWTIKLYTDNDGEPGEIVDSRETSYDPLGEYRFEGVPTGSYFVCEEGREGWYQSSPNTNGGCYPVTLSKNGEEITDRDFGNFRRINVTVIKDVVKANGDPLEDTSEDEFDFEINNSDTQDFVDEFSLTDGIPSGNNSQTSVTPGTYDITEVLNSNYEFQGCTVSGGTSNNPVYDEEDNLIGINVTVNSGDNEVTVTCTNKQKTGTITGTKWNDINENALRDCELFDLDGESNRESCEYTEPVLENWTIELFQSGEGWEKIGETKTDSSGNYQFTVNPGTYRVCEVIKSGWDQTYPINSEYEDYCYDITVGSDETSSNWNFGNHNKTPILTISKVNDAAGDKSPGDSVGFTITVAADEEGGPADNVTVTDLLPKGFVFNSGSWKVVSSDTTRGVSGDITSLLTAPTYASPGTWSLGYMNSGETLTLSYTATIDGSQQTGTYYDNAWAVGNPVESPDKVFAKAFGDGDLDIPDPDSLFVGTQVSIVNPNQPGVDYKATSTQEVLGASTYLPATGENTLWVIIATLLSVTGFGMLIAGLRLRRKYA